MRESDWSSDVCSSDLFPSHDTHCSPPPSPQKPGRIPSPSEKLWPSTPVIIPRPHRPNLLKKSGCFHSLPTTGESLLSTYFFPPSVRMPCQGIRFNLHAFPLRYGCLAEASGSILKPTTWVHLDLNQESRDYESPALTVELWTRHPHPRPSAILCKFQAQRIASVS